MVALQIDSTTFCFALLIPVRNRDCCSSSQCVTSLLHPICIISPPIFFSVLSKVQKWKWLGSVGIVAELSEGRECMDIMALNNTRSILRHPLRMNDCAVAVVVHYFPSPQPDGPQ